MSEPDRPAEDDLGVQEVHLAGDATVRFRGSGTMREKPFTLEDWDQAPGEVTEVDGPQA